MTRPGHGPAAPVLLALTALVALVAVLLVGPGAAATPTSAAGLTSPRSPSPSVSPTADATSVPGPSDPSPSDPSPSEPAPSETVPTTPPAPAPTGAFSVTDAQLRWGLNDESNNRAFAPGTFNFLSAGEVPDPGSGGNTVRDGTWSSTGAQAWAASAGNVRIEKRTASGAYAPATFAGLSTQADGTPLGGPAAGTFSGHQVVVDGGTGVVDPGAGTATVQWSGTFSVLYYSGMSLFTVTDPRLVVTPTTAVLRGTLGGYASDMVDTSEWVEVAPLEVTLADLPRAGLTLAGAGFNATPAYLGVTYDAPGDQVTQVRTGPTWGAFPSSFVAGMSRAGSAPYFYSSGGSADAFKVAKPLTFSWSAGAPIAQPASETRPGVVATTGPRARSPKAPSAPAAPETTSAPTGTGSTDGSGRSVAPTTSVPVAAPALAGIGLPPAGTDLTVPLAAPLPGSTVPTIYALTSAAAAPDPNSDHRWTWWLGSLLLLGAAGVTLHGSRLKGHP